MIALALLASALAEPCVGGYAVATVPPPEAVDVPVDVVLAAALFADCSAVPSTWRMQLYRDGALVHEELVNYEGEARIETRPAEPLAQDTRYELHVLPEGGGAEAIAGFTTGDAGAVALSGVPEVVGVAATLWRADGLLSVSGEVEAVDDPLSIVGLAFSPDSLSGRAFAAGAPGAGLSATMSSGVMDELCVVPVQWGADGGRVEGEERCVPVTIERSGGIGCDTAGSPAAGWPLALLLLARRRAWSSSSR